MEATASRQRIDEPERASDKGAVVRWPAVRRKVSVHQGPAGAESLTYRVDCHLDSFRPAILELRHRDQKDRGIEILRAVRGCVGVQDWIPSMRIDIRPQSLALTLPDVCSRGILISAPRDPGGAVKGDKSHQL